MEATLTVIHNGEEFKFPVKLDKTQIHRLYDATQSNEHTCGWEKPKVGQTYYYEDAAGRVQSMVLNQNEGSLLQANMLYDIANCFSSEGLAKDIARSNVLMRKLHRYAIEHREKPIDENDGYTIMYNYQDRQIEIGLSGGYLSFGDILFESEDNARDAINEFADELTWYFTEFKNRL